MDFAAAKALLQRKEGDASAYDLLTEVVLKILSDQPANAVSAFEELSASVKASAFPISAPDARAGGGSGAAQLAEAKAERRDKLEALFKLPGGDDESAAPEPVQNFSDDAHYLEWAGVSFGRTQAFRLHLALKHLAAKQPVRSLRFWGKIFGTTADYWVAECEADAPEDEPEDAKDALGNAVHRTGDGPNKHVYFVCGEIGDEWTRLPNVTPHQVIVARKIRRFFSGRLDAAVSSHPPFPGGELIPCHAFLLPWSYILTLVLSDTSIISCTQAKRRSTCVPRLL
jgi:radial spoke head protein 4/6